MLSVGVVVITHQAKKHLPHCLPHYLHSPLHPRVLVVNSSSFDGTVELADKLGAETLVVPREEFNHGSTREKTRKFLDTDIVVMATPDAYPMDMHVLGKLITPLTTGEASVAYARQVPHEGAGFFEAFPRHYNYARASHVRGMGDQSVYGSYTIFCSDTCAAYMNSHLDEVGGFDSVLIGEDTLVTAKLLQKGYKIAYVSEAVVKHSHRHSLKQEFQRYFDTGYSRKRDLAPYLLEGGDAQRGKEFVFSMMKAIMKEKKYLLIPYALFQNCVRWLGYHIGSASTHSPIWFKRVMSSQKFYWNSKEYKESWKKSRE